MSKSVKVSKQQSKTIVTLTKPTYQFKYVNHGNKKKKTVTLQDPTGRANGVVLTGKEVQSLRTFLNNIYLSNL